MGSIIKPFMPGKNRVPTQQQVNQVKFITGGKLSDSQAANVLQLKPPSAEVSPDTDVVNDGVKKVMKKGEASAQASTIVTGVMGDISKPKFFKPLLGGGS
jgi:hypothetical protein